MYKLNYFNFEERENNYLITNDLGKYQFLSKDNFKKLMMKEELENDIKEQLIQKRFIYDENSEIFANKSYLEVRKQKNYIFTPTALHIIVVTKNCNFNCVYCQAGNLSQKENFNMDIDTAKRCVDIALQSPTKYITIEFQGGEPLLNFDVIKFIVKYANENANGKYIEYNLVSNLTLLTDDMIQFIKDNNLIVCTSIDGNRELQNKNRPYANNDSYNETIKKIKQLQEHNIPVSAIQTTTRYSLNKYKEIVDEYINLGFKDLFVRPLTQLGKADRNWEKIGYSAEEFIEFYKNILSYIIEKNKEGINISERHSCIFLKKILANEPINYMELRSPCGGAIGQMAYYYDGNVYTCDEGRMLSEMGDDSFKIGNVFENNYNDLVKSDTTKALCVSSCLECLNKCHSCVYMPFCGTCPVTNLAQENNIFSRIPENYRCKIYKGIQDTLFGYIDNSNSEDVQILKGWISNTD
ncbi:MAG: His-Xaa-Ser system radical SAM maturase HxsB [Clostridia bacterium]|nr:His-Xaa-Ser system radical SAM maturase HxsB [Clostridia bacterium]